MWTLRAATALLVVACGAGYAASWPAVPLPEAATGELVSEHMKYNGLDMRASRFATPRKLDEVILFYTGLWTGQYVMNKVGPKTIIGHAIGKHYVTIELEQGDGGTEGTVGIMQLPKKGAKPKLGEGIYRPASAEVISDITYLDTPGKTRTVLMKNKMSPYVNYQSFVQRMSPQGWKGTLTGPCKPASSACVAHFEGPRGGKMAMTLTREGKAGTVLALNIE